MAQPVWNKMGVGEFVRNCKQLTSQLQRTDGSLAFNTKDAIDLNKHIYRMVNGGVKGSIKKELVINGLTDISAFSIEIIPLILDTFNILDAETCILDPISDERMNLAAIIKGSEKIFSEKLIKERLEVETLQEMKILNNKGFQTKFIKLKTKLYYKQKKFNLFREECEGYSKLITEINQRPGSVTVEHILEVIKSLIGCFNLDPNRVLDVILDSFECHTDQSDFYVTLLKNYMPQSKVLCEVLGFKYVHFQNSSDNTPESLYMATAILLQYDVIQLEDIYCWSDFYVALLKNYMPQSKVLCEVLGFKYVHFQNSSDNTPESLYMATAILLQYDVIQLEDIYCWLTLDDKLIIENWQKEFIDNDIPYKNGFSKIVVLEKNDLAEDIEKKEEEYKNMEKHERNQKFGLLEALLKIGDWKTFLKISDKLPSDYLMSYPPIAFAMCNLLHPLIDPVYKKNYTLGPKLPGSQIKPLKSPMAPKAANTFLDLRETVFPMLHMLGPYLGCDVKLLYKVIRTTKAALVKSKDDRSDDSLYFDVISVLDLAILPTISSLEYNCCISEEVWEIMKLYPYHVRYCLYGRWKNDVIKKYPHLALHNVYVQKKAREVVKRVSKDASKVYGRLLGKLTHFLPGTLFDYLLTQILLYENLISPIVDSVKYLGSMSYDILAYCILELLSSPGRASTKHKDVTLSTWLVNLAEFSGCIFKKYTIELTGILQYICNQVKIQQSFDLIFLKELVQKMTGIDLSDNMTNDQLMALCGGDTLKAEAGYFNHVRNTKKSALRLKEALLSDDLAFSLCFLIAQQRDCIIYNNPGSLHLKLVGKLYDQCQETFINYGTFLGSQLSAEEYNNQLPDMISLMNDYHMSIDVVFFLSRPMINHQINQKFDQLRKADPNYKKNAHKSKLQMYYNAVTAISFPIGESIRSLYSSKIWEDMSPHFLSLFWSLSLYDIYHPTLMYLKEIARLKHAITLVPENKELTTSKAKKEQDRLNGIIEKLHEENKKQTEHTERVLYRLNQDKSTWFIPKAQKITKNETITQFLQHCLLPRCIFTMVDALFCAKFIHKLHVIKTPNFSTLLCYDRLFCDIVYTVTLCTENEARRFGRFLCEVLETVMRWHSEKDIFEEECANFPGFVTKFRVSNKFCEANDHVGYENYRHVCHKWHYKITKALVVCLETKDYIQIRNALIILTKILPHFPVLLKLAQIIEKKVEKVRDEEKTSRPDLYTLAISYCGLLKSKSVHYIREQDFHHVTQIPTIVTNQDINPVTNMASNNPPVINLIKEENMDSKYREGRPIEVISSDFNSFPNKEKSKKYVESGSAIIVDRKISLPINKYERGQRDLKRAYAVRTNQRPSQCQFEYAGKRVKYIKLSSLPINKYERGQRDLKRAYAVRTNQRPSQCQFEYAGKRVKYIKLRKYKDDLIDNEKPLRKVRDEVEKKVKEKKLKEDKVADEKPYWEERRIMDSPSYNPNYVYSSNDGAETLEYSSVSYRRSESSERDTKRRKADSGISGQKLNQHRSDSVSPDSSSTTRKEKRKTKKLEHFSPNGSEKKILRKRRGGDEVIIVNDHKKRKAEEKGSKLSHQNGDEHNIKSVVHVEKLRHHSVDRDRETREKQRSNESKKR